MLIRTSLAALAAVLLTALTSAPPASAAKLVEQREYVMDVTGIQVADWNYRSSTYPDNQAGWTTGSGTQTYGWSLRRPVVLSAIAINGKLPGGGAGARPFNISGAMKPASVRASVTRKSSVTRLSPPPACEGSNLDPSCLWMPVPETVAQSCGRRVPKVELRFTQPSTVPSRFDVEGMGTPSKLFTDCAPDSGVLAPVYALGGARLDMRFPGAIAKLKAMRRGQRIKLHEETREGECELPPAANRFQRCVTTDVTVEVRRRK